MLSDTELSALLRMAARELSDTVAPAISASYPNYVTRALSTVLDDVALAVARRTQPAAPSRPESGDRPIARLLSLALAEGDSADRSGADIDSAQAADRAAIAHHAAEISKAQIDACLARSKDFAGTIATSITRLSGGFSKETYLIDTNDGRGVVLRRDMPFGPVLGSAVDEAGLLSELHARGLPVPSVLLAGRDPDLLGRSFLLVERMEGENAGDVSRRDQAAAAQVALGLARALGALHAIDPADAGLACSGDARAVVRAYIASWRDYWIERRTQESALIEEALAWLLDHIPQHIPRLVIIHGDARPDNMLAKPDGEVTALLDWEFQHAGDAAEDVEYAWNFVQDAVSRSTFIDAYLAAGGVNYAEDNAVFHSIWRAVRNLICLDAGWSGFLRGPYPVFNLGAPRLLFRRHLVKDLASSLATLADANADA